MYTGRRLHKASNTLWFKTQVTGTSCWANTNSYCLCYQVQQYSLFLCINHPNEEHNCKGQLSFSFNFLDQVVHHTSHSDWQSQYLQILHSFQFYWSRYFWRKLIAEPQDVKCQQCGLATSSMARLEYQPKALVLHALGMRPHTAHLCTSLCSIVFLSHYDAKLLHSLDRVRKKSMAWLKNPLLGWVEAWTAVPHLAALCV